MIATDAGAELADLKAYLGDSYDERRLERSQAEVDSELERLGSEERLYRESEAYLYDLTMFAMSATKDPYLADLERVVPPPARLLDYGCGIGSDGLRLINAGYSVAFADFDNPSVEYLRWRLERRGLVADVYDLDHDEIPPGFDLAYSFDVLEHVDDPFDLLAKMEAVADRVLVNVLETDETETPLHRSPPVDELLRYATGRKLLRYGIYHGRSHLLLYGSAPSRGVASLVSRGRLALGRRRTEP
ncbi:MAG: mycofactocin glycosyltransferase [Solirubrobacterales bacterium]|jgi:SAM-dependent methyltransferase|nr:mycofactocin glycosyltransferase [Solirubrobacterales bacterium]